MGLKRLPIPIHVTRNDLYDMAGPNWRRCFWKMKVS